MQTGRVSHYTFCCPPFDESTIPLPRGSPLDRWVGEYHRPDCFAHEGTRPLQETTPRTRAWQTRQQLANFPELVMPYQAALVQVPLDNHYHYQG